MHDITVQNAYIAIIKSLKKVNRTLNYAEDLLHFLLKTTYINFKHKLTRQEQQRLKSLLKRIENDEPIEYILHKAEFYGHHFIVNESTLIPRPSTEILIDKFWDDFRTLEVNKQEKIAILDIGTGCGNIIITLALLLKKYNAQFWATDIDPQILDIAKLNATNYNTKIHFFISKSDWIAKAFTFLQADVRRLFVISNPPYIPITEKDKVDRSTLQYEPHTALFKSPNFLNNLYIEIVKFNRKIPTHIYLEWAENNKIIYITSIEELKEKIYQTSQKLKN